LLSNNQNRVRTIVGSFNLSLSAIEGNQKELIFYSDNKNFFEQLLEYFNEIKTKSKKIISSKDIKPKIHQYQGNIKKIKTEIVTNPEEAQAKLFLPIQSEILKSIVDNFSAQELKFVRSQLENNKTKLENQIKALEKLIENEKEIKLAKKSSQKLVNLLKEKEITQISSNLKFSTEEGFIYKGIPVKDIELSITELEQVKNLLNEYIDFCYETSQALPKLVGESIVYGFATAYIPLLRKKIAEEGGDLNTYPIVALLVGTAKAGKTTALKSIGKLIGVKTYQFREVKEIAQRIKNKEGKQRFRSYAYFIESYLFGDNLFPLTVDEVPPIELSESRTLMNVLKNSSEMEEVNSTLILTSNLDKFRTGTQLLRRSCFLPFENIVKENKKLSELLLQLNTSLFIKFLQVLNNMELKPNENDPLYIARSFLLDEGIKVPSNYQGSYEGYILKGWEKLYLTSREKFIETRAKHKKTGELVPCLKIAIKDCGHLVPLEVFDNGVLSGTGEYLLLKKEFEEAINIRSRKRGPFQTLKNFLRKKF
jgi:hypothetical protein